MLEARGLLVDTEDYAISVDGMLIEKKPTPLRNIIYELALKIHELEKEKDILNLTITKLKEDNSIMYSSLKSLVMEHENIGNDLYKEILEKREQVESLETRLDKIKELINKIDTSDGCAYGDYNCDNCSDLEEDTVCTYKVKKLIQELLGDV